MRDLIIQMSKEITQGVPKRGRTGLYGELNLMISQNAYLLIKAWYTFSSRISRRFYLRAIMYFGRDNFIWIVVIHHFEILRIQEEII